MTLPTESSRRNAKGRPRVLSNIFDHAPTTEDASLQKHVHTPSPAERVRNGVSDAVDGVRTVREWSPMAWACLAFGLALWVTWMWLGLTECRVTWARRRRMAHRDKQHHELSTTQETSSQLERQDAVVTFATDCELSVSSIHVPGAAADDADVVSVCTWETDASFRSYLEALDSATATLHGLASVAAGSLVQSQRIRRCVRRTLDMMRDATVVADSGTTTDEREAALGCVVATQHGNVNDGSANHL